MMAVTIDQARVFALGVERLAHLARCTAWPARRPADRRTGSPAGRRPRPGRADGDADAVAAGRAQRARQGYRPRPRVGSGRGGAARDRAAGRGIRRPGPARSGGPRSAGIGRATPLGMPSLRRRTWSSDGGITGEIVARGHAIEVARPSGIGRLTCQDAVDRDQVVALRMRHRADDGQLIGPCRQAGEDARKSGCRAPTSRSA